MPLAAWRENNSRHVASLRRIRLAFSIASPLSAISGARLSGLRGAPIGRRGVTGYEPRALTRVRDDGRIEIAIGADIRVLIIGSVAAERIEQVLAMLRRSA
jgi:hypothetical protein